MSTLSDRLAAAAQATFTDEARLAVEEAAVRIAWLEAQYELWKQMHDSQLHMHQVDMQLRRDLEQRVKTLEASHGQDKP
jgi:hypothetical protein